VRQVSHDFIIDGRVTWVEIEGMPLKMWSENTFNRVAAKCGVLLDVDDKEDGCLHRDLKNVENLEGDSDGDVVSDTKFDEETHIKNDAENSRDGTNKDLKYDDSLRYPPGFTPRDNKDDSGDHSYGSNKNIEQNIFEEGEIIREKKANSKQKSKNDVEESICSGYFKKSEMPSSGGSVLLPIDELIKVGETMGYNMEGCIKNMEQIIEVQGVNEVDR
ncbi:hypothetical protein Tco_1325343, partial [Tanacetum coccineum]